MGSEGASIVAMAVVLILVLLAIAARQWGYWPFTRVDTFLDPSQNIGVYDRPYTNYPSYAGRAALRWDSDNRCVANCQQSPCVTWCR
jgi:hypothetical protein